MTLSELFDHTVELGDCFMIYVLPGRYLLSIFNTFSNRGRTFHLLNLKSNKLSCLIVIYIMKERVELNKQGRGFFSIVL